MEITYINLSRRPDRNERFLATNAGLATFHRMEAIDGKQLHIDELIRAGLVREPLPGYTAGALGCALSHKQVWEHCAAGQGPLTVAEDDAIFNRHFARKAEEVLRKLPADWDIILWGWNFDSLLYVELIEGLREGLVEADRRPLGPRADNFQHQDWEVLPLRLLAAFGIMCYSITPKGARRLLQGCFPLANELIQVPVLGRILNFGIDGMMIKSYRSLRAYVSFPPLVWSENDKATSDVERSRE